MVHLNIYLPLSCVRVTTELGSDKVGIGKGGLSSSEVVDVVEMLCECVLLHQSRRGEVRNLKEICNEMCQYKRQRRLKYHGPCFLGGMFVKEVSVNSDTTPTNSPPLYWWLTIELAIAMIKCPIIFITGFNQICSLVPSFLLVFQ